MKVNNEKLMEILKKNQKARESELHQMLEFSGSENGVDYYIEVLKECYPVYSMPLVVQIRHKR